MPTPSAMLYTAFEQQAQAWWPLRQWARAAAPMLANGPSARIGRSATWPPRSR